MATGEASPGTPVELGLARDSAIEHGGADDDVARRIAAGSLRLAHHDPPARQTLADVIVGIADEVERYTVRQPCTEALPGNAAELDADRVGRKAAMAISPRDLARKHRAHRTVYVADCPFKPARGAALDRKSTRLNPSHSCATRMPSS